MQPKYVESQENTQTNLLQSLSYGIKLATSASPELLIQMASSDNREYEIGDNLCGVL